MGGMKGRVTHVSETWISLFRGGRVLQILRPVSSQPRPKKIVYGVVEAECAAVQKRASEFCWTVPPHSTNSTGFLVCTSITFFSRIQLTVKQSRNICNNSHQHIVRYRRRRHSSHHHRTSCRCSHEHLLYRYHVEVTTWTTMSESATAICTMSTTNTTTF